MNTGRDGRSPAPLKRRRVYFNEYNILMEKTAYLPIVSGLLRAYAETSEVLKSRYEFMPFLYYRDFPKNILPHYEEPAVAAFSVSMWNEQLNLQVARDVKKRFPECLVVFGGPQVPHHPQEYFREFPFVDVAVRAEGEEAFSEILARYLDSRDFSDIAGVAWRHPKTGECIRNQNERSQPKDLDMYPSPYLEGLFDSILATRTDMKFQAIIETNRGCPFPCTFCFWGQGGLSRKYRFHGIDRVAKEIEWCARNKILYIFNADSNFGMHQRDKEIAQILVDTKKRYGYPEKFRTCFGKNTDDKIFEIAIMLHGADLEKGITLARQSNDEEVLKNIRRQNIKLSTYENLQVRFNEKNVPVYSEMILGLPGETLASWTQGIEMLFQSGLSNQLFVYLCEVFPNTEMAEPEYQKKFGIVTQRIHLTEIHGGIHQDDMVREFEDIIVATDAMPLADWKRMAVFSWTMMTLHSLKVGFFVMIYLHDRFGVRYTDFLSYISEERMPKGTGAMLRSEIAQFHKQTDRLLQGHGRGHPKLEYGPIYWDEEEVSFLRISEDMDRFYQELLEVVGAFLRERKCAFDEQELAEVIRYQRLRIPSLNDPAVNKVLFHWNLPEYFALRLTPGRVPLQPHPQLLTVHAPQYKGSRPMYARKTILWGRKSGTMMTQVKWEDARTEGVAAPA